MTELKRAFFSGTNVKVNHLDWQKSGLQFTASGYGRKIPTKYMVWNGKRWQRVYCCIYSNSGSLYIVNGKEWTFVDLDTRHALSEIDRIQVIQ